MSDNNGADTDSDSDYDSLFDGDGEDTAIPAASTISNKFCARRSCPEIPGLFFDPSIEIPTKLANTLWSQCKQTFFRNPDVNQVMLFERAPPIRKHALPLTVEVEDKNGSADWDQPPAALSSSASGIPSFLTDLLGVLDGLLKKYLPLEKHALLFPKPGHQTRARQVILNHYRPGEGITPHVDLLGRYDDGIIGVSLHSGCVMRFAKIALVDPPPAPNTFINVDSDSAAGMSCDQKSGNQFAERYGNSKSDGRSSENLGAIKIECHNSTVSENVYRLYLPARSVLILCDDARYIWTHGIERLTEDLIESEDGSPPARKQRGERISITFRWLLPGADVVGDGMDEDSIQRSGRQLDNLGHSY